MFNIPSIHPGWCIRIAGFVARLAVGTVSESWSVEWMKERIFFATGKYNGREVATDGIQSSNGK
jgi:hypothetical protein